MEVDGKQTTDPRVISQAQTSFYKKNHLYSKQLNEQDPMYTESSDLFFNNVNLPALTHEQKENCDQEIIESEILKSLKT